MKNTPNSILPLFCLLAMACAGSEPEAADTGTAKANTPAAGVLENAVKDVSATLPKIDTSAIANASLDEVMDLKKSLLKDTTSLLKGVTDVDSAKAALPSLDAIAQQIGPLSNREDAVKDGSLKAKASYAKQAVDFLGSATGFTEEVARIQQIPGVMAVLDSSIDGIIGYFKG